MNQTYLKEILHYCPDTGVFTWKERLARCVRVGDVAGALSKGYRSIKVKGIAHAAHRLAWLYMTGVWPSGVIDHIHGGPDDNHWANLRDVSSSVNNGNRHKVRTDASEAIKYPGVRFVSKSAKGLFWKVSHGGGYRMVTAYAENLLDAVALKKSFQRGEPTQRIVSV